MPSTVYKGDVSEVAFAPETGLDIIDNVDCQFALTNANGVTTIRFSAESNTTLFEAGTSKLKYPKNALVGSQLTFKGIDDGKIFTIIENDGATIKISPAVSSTTVTSNDVLSILPYKTPPMDTAGHTERNETFTVGGGTYNNDDPTIDTCFFYCNCSRNDSYSNRRFWKRGNTYGGICCIV
jgi:hypothetical protein